MAQRNFFHTPQIPNMDRDQIWNPSDLDHHLHLGAGNSSYMLPMDGAASAVVSRPNDHLPSAFSNYTATNSGPLHDSYFHPSLIPNSVRLPSDQLQSMPPPGFDQHGGSMVGPHAEIGRAAYKRKSPAMPLAFSGGSSSGYYSAGSSSNLQMSFDPLHPKPMVRPHYGPVDPAIISHSYRADNLLTAGEDSVRNVRSRLNHTGHAQTNPAFAYSSSNMAPHFHTGGAGRDMDGQSSHIMVPMASQGRNLSSDHCFNYEGNQSVAGSGIISPPIGTTMVFHSNLSQSRNTNSLPTIHDPTIRGIGSGSAGYNHRSYPHSSSSGFTSVGFATASNDGDGGPSRIESVSSSRYSRPLSISGRSTHRNGRMRSSYSRFQSGYDETSRTRWSSEGAVMMGRATYYDSRNWLDQHRDMRLDIDDMSYEELLALEERIGNVSTGLSEEAISCCLQELTHCPSSQRDSEENDSCAICLEDYKDQDNLGRLGCRHDFHAGCIRSWLLIKNACPICKAAAFGGSSKGKTNMNHSV